MPRQRSKILAEKLVKLREDRGCTQRDVAETIDRPQSRIAKWELGEGEPKPPQLLKLAQFFGVPLEYLCDDKMTSPSEAESKKAPELSEDEVLIIQIARRVGHSVVIKRLLAIDGDEAEGES